MVSNRPQRNQRNRLLRTLGANNLKCVLTHVHCSISARDNLTDGAIDTSSGLCFHQLLSPENQEVFSSPRRPGDVWKRNLKDFKVAHLRALVMYGDRKVFRIRVFLESSIQDNSCLLVLLSESICTTPQYYYDLTPISRFVVYRIVSVGYSRNAVAIFKHLIQLEMKRHLPIVRKSASSTQVPQIFTPHVCHRWVLSISCILVPKNCGQNGIREIYRWDEFNTVFEVGSYGHP